MSILSLQETSSNSWKAKYRGNYGVYTIKITKHGAKTIDFSCSCPSPYSPCKHIPMIEKAIEKRIAKNAEDGKIAIEDLLKDLSQKELYDFLVRQAQYNSELKKAILLDFSDKITNANSYSLILREALESFHFDSDDIDEMNFIEIEEIDQWLNKAQDYIDCNIPSEAILICKACIEF